MTKFHDLCFSSMKDGSIRLTQTDCGEDSIIDAHPEQLLFIARSICGLKPETAGRIAELERRLAVLTDKLQDVVCDQYFRNDILDRCGDGLYLLAKLDAVVDLALEFDGGRLKPAGPEEAGEVVPPDGAEPKPSRFQPMAPPTKPDGQLGLTL